MSYILNFKNWNRVHEAEGSDQATITPLGDTGINVVTFGEDQGFSAPDSKPYVLLLGGSVQFQGLINNQTVTVILEQTNFERPGAYKTVNTVTGEPNRTMIASGNNLDLYTSVNLMSNIVGALYGSVGTGETGSNRVMQTIKAMKIIKNDYPTEIANNLLFTNLYKKMVEVYNARDVQTLYTKMNNQKATNMQEVLDGAKKAFKTA